MNIVVDIWGGEASQDHVARYFLSVEKAFEMARIELADGFLVNLRAEIGWGPRDCFDKRLHS